MALFLLMGAPDCQVFTQPLPLLRKSTLALWAAPSSRRTLDGAPSRSRQGEDLDVRVTTHGSGQVTLGGDSSAARQVRRGRTLRRQSKWTFASPMAGR